MAMTRKSKTGIALVAAALALVAGVVFKAGTGVKANLVTLHCNLSHFRQVDPIVSPGIEPSAHEHTFYGANGTDQFSTPTSISTETTSCKTVGDTAAYWVPTLFVDGKRVSSKNLHIGEYWFANNDANVQTPPFGMEFVAGNSHATSLAEESPSVRWHCKNGKEAADSSNPVTCDTSTGPLKYEIFFANCWDGLGTAPADFTYSTDGVQGKTCPAAFPNHIAQLGLQTDLVDSTGQPLYNPFNADGSLRVSFASGPFYTAHADFMNGFNMNVLNGIVQGCMLGKIACPPHS